MSNNKYVYVILGMVLSLAVFGASLSFGAELVPGSEDDPLVSRSYVDGLFEKLSDAVDAKLEELKETMSGSGQAQEPSQSQEYTQVPAASSFKVVEVPAGTRVVGYEGTELIVRSGYAFAVDNGVDGISDLTDGTDLKGGAAISKNHLLLVPRSDGRGIDCQGLCYVMIKGEYSFE